MHPLHACLMLNSIICRVSLQGSSKPAGKYLYPLGASSGVPFSGEYNDRDLAILEDPEGYYNDSLMSLGLSLVATFGPEGCYSHPLLILSSLRGGT